jgi:hypothetical protein
MSDANTPVPGSGGGMGGPVSRPDGDGLPPKTGGLTPPGGEDSRDPGIEGEGDRGEDSGGMIGEG